MFCLAKVSNYFEAPKGSGKSTIFTSNLWLGGVDNQGNLYVAAQKFCQKGFDFRLGPQTNDYILKDTVIAGVTTTVKTYSDAYIQKYYHTWSVTPAEIEYHKNHYADPGYVMPWAIANWPAHGRTQFGESANLAPFVDADGNGVYSPITGDYPKIRGDQTVFFIINDADKHTESGSIKSIGVDILGMAYAFNSSDAALQNTLFLSYELRNKGSNTLYDFYFGFWTDFDIGYANDDYVGCDTTMNIMYGYNGTEIDGNGEAWAYGENPPAQGAMFLNQKMSAFVYHNNDQSGVGDPIYAIHYYNFLRALWMDNSPMTYGGNGYGGTERTRFMFSGDPVTNTGWTELTPNGPGSTPNTPGDRRGLMSAGPFTFPAGGKLTVDIALPFARTDGGKSAVSSLTLLKQYAPALQEYFNANILGIQENKSNETTLLLYPNPSNGQFTIASEKIIESVDLYDLLGKKLFSDTPNVQTAQLSTHLPQGFYIYRVILQDKTVTSGKIVVQ